jgi:hypothetical protein
MRFQRTFAPFPTAFSTSSVENISDGETAVGILVVRTTGRAPPIPSQDHELSSEQPHAELWASGRSDVFQNN